MKHAEKVKLGISIGDLNGIGSEIVLKTFDDSRMLDFCTPIIFASTKVLTFLKKQFNLSLNYQGIDDASKAIDGKINVVNVWKEGVNINFGEEDPKIGEYAFKSLQAATHALKSDEIDVLVTAPINKHSIQSADFNFPGHTDYLAKELEGESLMFMITDTLKIGLLTDHVALKDIANTITPELIEKKLKIIQETLKQDFRIQKPKIAVLGINPHSGDNGVIGKEDEEILKPTLQKLRDKGDLVFGPFSADSFFGSKNYVNFDAVVASYHDQGLIPFKTLSFGNGVNFTAGLSKVRTSPDHGTAFEIAGTNSANINSFKEAVFRAIEIYKCREEYKELTKNPLKKQGKKL
ncbi:4-hydroxythreonine-4-phosphate dehydrogenase PdxA [Salegentibacter mishustinae]|uniref:4-hydroxythreonine-4-phosphate dehydrogenase n=1 Tax=Salegentibacter mishustinae TaxID=270918 RepID=A0A0Q9ZFH4_9FLAO|nr:4-hydroxythreonine-4-phosphate dehydrogenase PdxA [Salegentibacter mishustinae]KRG27716.1 4-hydroxythreonine-4-phosphate dehydrogenase [Salegentibacter mishustinae]PNW20785.1 4-hydroxythreonine-4-phosphate dehydrogenase [Salegentibacter mishustinae]PZX64214.1 4-hydroxythreonine-4-phosphate dehydrogenase [Salegentibacter mishustinae]GGW90885.1 4-hydroxythreonine-4-phosphate dehydrogenase [Salegentibacter mishustinae]